MKSDSFYLFALLASGIITGYSQNKNPSDIDRDTLKITLKEVWQQTDVRSKKALIHQKEIEIRQENTKDAKMERYPVFNAFGRVEKASNIPVYTNGIFHKPEQHDVIHTLYNSGVSMYLNLYNGNKQNLEIEERKTLEDKAIITAEQSQSEVRLEAAKSYLALAKVMRFKEVMIADIADQKKQLGQMENLYKNGVVLKSDVLRASMEISKREMTLVQIENDILIENQKLVLLMGISDSDFIKPQDIYAEVAPVESYEEALEIAEEHAHKHLLSEEDLALSEIELKKVKANTKPSIGLIGNFTMANPQIFLYPYNPSWYSLGTIGVQISFPISSLYHNVHKKRSHVLEHHKEEIQHLHVQDQIKQEVQEAYLRYQESLVQIQVCTKNQEEAFESARIIKNTYFNSTSLYIDLLDADVQYLQTQFELEAAKLDSIYKYYSLQLAKGLL
ncbi:TolC family protein [Myroides phaeus]|uniref:Outer membrane protein TolC n=1 Tax=Myroides phaeus TaxID=702745 RepID=A0A1G8ELF0_9FLAO|nr:TolC family protein [Myroides phaeus]MEC4117758.1 TolC family protein [Myroides phaeus]SDH70734.1 Outer membrane protein TolC [Myroides phaeus]